jgi:hypothetical protein
MAYENRYKDFFINNAQVSVPFVKLTPKSSDVFIKYQVGKTRIDKLAETYYNDPTAGWLIMVGNPEYGGLEANIPDSTYIRIPFPGDAAKKEYKDLIREYNRLYGI